MATETVPAIASAENQTTGKRNVAIIIILVVVFAAWMTFSQTPQARILKHKFGLAVAALVKGPFEPAADDWEPVAPAPMALLESAGTIVDGKFYVFGGIARPTTFSLVGTTTVYRFDPGENSWTQRADMPAGLTHVLPAVDGNDIWLAGGWFGSRAGGFTGTNEVWIYNTAADTWRQGPSLPEKIASAGLARVGRSLHFFGGFLGDDGDRMSAAHWVLEIDGGTEWKPRAPLPHKRGHISATVIGNSIYAIGGMDRHHADPDDLTFVHRYDTDTDSWTELAPLLDRRSHFESSTFVYDGRIYTVGGKNYSSNPIWRERGVPFIDRYDPASDTWTRLPGLPGGLLGASAGVIDDYLYVLTGSRSSVFHGQSAGYRRPWDP